MTYKDYEGIKDYLYSEFDSEIVDDFLMMYDIIEDNFEIVIDNLKIDFDSAINDLFRMMHNFKSATAFLKVDRMNNFAQLVEDILDDMRKKRVVNDKIVDWLFEVANQLHTWYQDIELNRALSPINPKVLKLPKV